MSSLFSELLETRPVLVADGAMGTSLFALGLETGDCPERWNIDHPDKVASVHAGFVEAGSDLFLTNTFGANRRRLMLHEATDRVGDFNRAGSAVGRRVADDARARTGKRVAVCGSVGPTGDILAPVGALSIAEATAVFAEQMVALAEGGVDAIWIETISSREELQAALAAAAEIGLPVVATMSFDTHGRTMMGLTPADALASALAATGAGGVSAAPAAFGANCGIGPAQLLESVLALRQAGPTPIVAKGNCGIPVYKDGQLSYSGSPEIMGDYACLARDAGARIIGGCCGTTPAHIAAIARTLAARPTGPSPDYATIERVLGAIATIGASATEQAEPGGDEQSPAGRGRRRGRAQSRAAS